MLKYYYLYSFFGLIRLIRDKIFTIIFYPKARIVRLPLFIRGGNGINGGVNLTTGINLRIDIIKNDDGIYPELKIGVNVQINDYVHIGVKKGISIGDNTLIASKVLIIDHNHGDYSSELQSSPNTDPLKRVLKAETITIGRNVWIGEFVAILPGVSIGDGAIIGTMSVVVNDIPPNTISIGNPAKPIKIFDFNTNKWEKINN